MDEERIESAGLEPLLAKLRELGGWPVLEGDAWNAAGFDWKETVYRFRREGYSTDYLVDFSIVTDSKNSSWRVIDIDQVLLKDMLSRMIIATVQMRREKQSLPSEMEQLTLPCLCATKIFHTWQMRCKIYSQNLL